MEKCKTCDAAESTYPLDPPGTLYCEFLDDYVSENNHCSDDDDEEE